MYRNNQVHPELTLDDDPDAHRLSLEEDDMRNEPDSEFCNLSRR